MRPEVQQLPSPTGDLAVWRNATTGSSSSSAYVSAGRRRTYRTRFRRDGHGATAYMDEFTVALRDSAGRYRSWPAAKVKGRWKDPAEAHVDRAGKVTRMTISNL